MQKSYVGVKTDCLKCSRNIIGYQSISKRQHGIHSILGRTAVTTMKREIGLLIKNQDRKHFKISTRSHTFITYQCRFILSRQCITLGMFQYTYRLIDGLIFSIITNIPSQNITIVLNLSANHQPCHIQ